MIGKFNKFIGIFLPMFDCLPDFQKQNYAHSINLFPYGLFANSTLEPRINVHVRLLIFEKNVALYALIKGLYDY